MNKNQLESLNKNSNNQKSMKIQLKNFQKDKQKIKTIFQIKKIMKKHKQFKMNKKQKHKKKKLNF